MPPGDDWIAGLRLLRPKQWVKNGFVLAPLLFSLKFREADALFSGLAAAALFCLVSSVGYILNDLCDLDNDRAHDLKKHRPLASGAICPGRATIIAVICLLLACLVAEKLPAATGAVALGYLALNFAYSFALKHLVVLDVTVLAIGFVLRVLGGAWAVGIDQPTSWLLLCTFLLALLLGFAKRRHELLVLGDAAESHRRVLAKYTPRMLDAFLAACAGACIVCYALYTIMPEAANPYKTDRMLYTVPFVVYGLFRYLYLAYRRREGGDPTATLLTDPGLLATVFLWAATCAALLFAGAR